MHGRPSGPWTLKQMWHDRFWPIAHQSCQDHPLAICTELGDICWFLSFEEISSIFSSIFLSFFWRPGRFCEQNWLRRGVYVFFEQHTSVSKKVCAILTQITTVVELYYDSIVCWNILQNCYIRTYLCKRGWQVDTHHTATLSQGVGNMFF